MPKTRAQKRYKGSVPTKIVSENVVAPPVLAQRMAKASAAQTSGTQALVMSAMVAVGCWGMAFAFTFLTNGQNHLLFGGIAAVMALMWSFSFGMRVRKTQQRH